MNILDTYKYRTELSANSFNNTFVCPYCKKSYPVEDAVCKVVPTTTKQVGYIRHGGTASSTVYRTELNSIRYCRKCTRKMKKNEYYWIAYFLIPGLVFNVILSYYFFDSPEIFGKGESFWGELKDRDIWSLIGWILGCGWIGLTILIVLKKIIGLFIKDHIPSLEQAIKENSLNYNK
ncbi:MAG: hypothetical protein K2J27_03840 [Duncaniella sp.]|nr:hypothetical protein [Duncaniella sp.]MDE6823845.1 hypothetical protein [Duncaniella sp.]